MGWFGFDPVQTGRIDDARRSRANRHVEVSSNFPFTGTQRTEADRGSVDGTTRDRPPSILILFWANLKSGSRFFEAFWSFETSPGNWGSRGCIPAIQVALQEAACGGSRQLDPAKTMSTLGGLLNSKTKWHDVSDIQDLAESCFNTYISYYNILPLQVYPHSNHSMFEWLNI